jgi:hypothetical protein
MERVGGLRAVWRTLGFLELALDDYVRASAVFRDDFERQRTHFAGQSRELTEAEVEWMKHGARLGDEVQFRIETFYFFARRLLDELVAMLGDALGPSQTSIGRHKALKKNLPLYVTERGLPEPPDDLLALWHEVNAQIAWFRDKQVAHPREPRRRSHGVMWGADQRLRLSIGTIYPRDENDVGLESGAPHDIADLLKRYVSVVVDYIEANLNAAFDGRPE